MKMFVFVFLACLATNAQSKPRDLTVQETHSILDAALPDATRKLSGYGLEDFSVSDQPRFYFVEVVWDNPQGSVVQGNYAIDKATGDLWSAVICDRLSTKRSRSLQQQIREEIGLTDDQYRRIKRPGPMCE